MYITVKKIVQSLYKWTNQEFLIWYNASDSRYKEIMDLISENVESEWYIDEVIIDNESYHIVLYPSSNPLYKGETRFSVIIIKGKEWIYSKGFGVLWFDETFSNKPFSKFLRHLEPFGTTENGLLEESKDYLTKEIESTAHSQNVNEILERQAQRIDFLMHKVSLLEEEIYILKNSKVIEK